MINKEQLLYFFLQGKISLSQYDYKFMANLQTMITNNNRVTSNQATLFDNLISKYKKQLTKNGMDKDLLKSLPWKTMVVDSTPEYTGATVSLLNDDLIIRVPFNKAFISAFRTYSVDNTFEWNKEFKLYKAPFSTNALKIAVSILPDYFPTVRYADEIQQLLNQVNQYKALIYKPTLVNINGNFIVVACNEVLGDLIKDIKLSNDPKTLFKLSMYGIDIDTTVHNDDPELKFAATRHYETEIDNLEQVIKDMKAIGCENVIIGRGLRSVLSQDGLTDIINSYCMNPVGPISFGKLPEGVCMLIQHTSNFGSARSFAGTISKTVVFRDSRPVEVK